jgi:hypothetical protein
MNIKQVEEMEKSFEIVEALEELSEEKKNQHAKRLILCRRQSSVPKARTSFSVS